MGCIQRRDQVFPRSYWLFFHVKTLVYQSRYFYPEMSVAYGRCRCLGHSKLRLWFLQLERKHNALRCYEKHSKQAVVRISNRLYCPALTDNTYRGNHPPEQTNNQHGITL